MTTSSNYVSRSQEEVHEPDLRFGTLSVRTRRTVREGVAHTEIGNLLEDLKLIFFVR